MKARNRKKPDSAAQATRDPRAADKSRPGEVADDTSHGAGGASRAASGWSSTTVAPAVLIIAAGIASYWNSFAGVFLFDDIPSILENRFIRQLWPLDEVLFPRGAGVAIGINGRPVVGLSLAINYALGGTNVWGYHAVNLAIHLLAALMLFGLVRRTLLLPGMRERFGANSILLALAVALLWVLHPLQTEAVTYVIQRAESLMGLFYLLTIYCVLRGATGERAMPWYLSAIVVCLLGMVTKEVMVTAPVVILLYDRAFLTGSFRQALRQRWALYAALAATWGGIVWSLVWSDFHAGATGFASLEFTWQSYLLTQPEVVLYYVRLAIWPSELCLDYAWPAPGTAAQIVIPGLLIAGLIGLTAWAVWKCPKLGFLGACFFLILSPTSSFVPINDAAFEHRMYLPLSVMFVGLVLTAFALSQAVTRMLWISPSKLGLFGVGFLMAVCVVLGVLTVRRNALYASELRMWQDTIEKAPHNARAHNNLGHVYSENGQISEALAQYETAVKLRPDLYPAQKNLGMSLAKVGRVDDAIVHYREALKINPDDAEAQNGLGTLLAERGQVDAAIAHYLLALKANPESAEAHNNLGGALLARGQIHAAIGEFRSAVKLKPEFAAAWYNLGEAFDRIGQNQEAVTCLREAVRWKHDDINMLNRLAWILATSPDAADRNGVEAVKLAERTCELSPQRGHEVLDTLAAAYAEVGQFERAVATQTKAVDLAPDTAKPEYAARLELYKSGNPFRKHHANPGSDPEPR